MSVSWQVSSALGTCCTQLDKEVLLCLDNNLLGDVTKHSGEGWMEHSALCHQRIQSWSMFCL